ncbi:hypothetical protein [Azotobacter armeniacus]
MCPINHPKSHAVSWTGSRWRLSPLYGVVPCLHGEPSVALAMALY